MEAIIKIIAVLIFMIILIRFSVDVGYVLLTGAVALGILFGRGLFQILESFRLGIFSLETLELLSIVYGITYMGDLMKRLGMLGELTFALEHLLKDVRLVAASIPALIGLLPMPGGALLSAPIMGEVTQAAGLSPAHSTAMNFWFRHIWEYTFPLYPGMILAVTFLKIDIPTLVYAQTPLTIAALIAGVIFLFPGVPKKIPGRANTNGETRKSSMRKLLATLSPIVVVVVFSFVFKLTLVIGLVTAIALVAFIRKAESKRLSESFKAVFLRKELFTLIIGVMVFSRLAQDADIVNTIPATLQGWGVPKLIIVFGVPFISAMITGITVAFIAMAYPLLAGYLLPGGSPDLPMAVWAFTGGFLGVLLSPVHLCLVLTREHFKAGWARTYAYLIPMGAIITLAGLACVLFGWPPQR
ncbi:MAG: DUF401 family protein [Spirochaetes bacterium]|nr:DUF401 family protein [Spirochaetota bacterium]